MEGHWAGHEFRRGEGATCTRECTTDRPRPSESRAGGHRSQLGGNDLEALELTNGSELTGMLSRGAEAIVAENTAQSPRALIDGLYLASLGRRPTKAELSVTTEMIGKPVQKSGVEDLLWAITMLPEFQLIY